MSEMSKVTKKLVEKVAAMLNAEINAQYGFDPDGKVIDYDGRWVINFEGSGLYAEDLVETASAWVRMSEYFVEPINSALLAVCPK